MPKPIHACKQRSLLALNVVRINFAYGAGLARHSAAAGARVVEVDRPVRQDRRLAGKSDILDAASAARAEQSGRALGAPKGRDAPWPAS